MVWYGYLISPGEAFSHEATSQGTQNSTDTSSKIIKGVGWGGGGGGGIINIKNKKAMH